MYISALEFLMYKGLIIPHLNIYNVLRNKEKIHTNDDYLIILLT